MGRSHNPGVTGGSHGDLPGRDDAYRLDLSHLRELPHAWQQQNLDRMIRLACALLDAPIGLVTSVEPRTALLPGRSTGPLRRVGLASLNQLGYSLGRYRWDLIGR